MHNNFWSIDHKAEDIVNIPSAFYNASLQGSTDSTKARDINKVMTGQGNKKCFVATFTSKRFHTNE